MDRKVFLVRHGHIDLDNEKRYIGVSDLPLSSVGIRQAAWIKQFLSDIHIEKVFCSPLKRCRQTADIIQEDGSSGVEIMEALREIDMGEWENRTIDYIKENFREMYEKRGEHPDLFVPPGGESFEQLQKRVMPAFEYIVASTSGNVLIIGHAGVNRVILSGLFDFPLQNIFKISQPYGCINRLSRDICQWRWEQINYDD